MTKRQHDKPTTPHDKFVKCAFTNHKIAIDFFVAHLGQQTGLSKEELSGFYLSNSEYQRAFKTKLCSDIVYRGEIEGQDYYITLEHQSSPDKTMLFRLLEYTGSLIREHSEQEHKGMPVYYPCASIITSIAGTHNTLLN